MLLPDILFWFMESALSVMTPAETIDVYDETTTSFLASHGNCSNKAIGSAGRSLQLEITTNIFVWIMCIVIIFNRQWATYCRVFHSFFFLMNFKVIKWTFKYRLFHHVNFCQFWDMFDLPLTFKINLMPLLENECI